MQKNPAFNPTEEALKAAVAFLARESIRRRCPHLDPDSIDIIVRKIDDCPPDLAPKAPVITPYLASTVPAKPCGSMETL